MINNSPAARTAQSLQTARDFSAQKLRLARREARAVDAVSRDPLIRSIINQVFTDGSQGWSDRNVDVFVGLSREGEAEIRIRDKDFSFAPKISDLHHAAKAISEEHTRGLLGRAGILEVVLAVLTIEPNSMITLTDKTVNDESGGRNTFYKAVAMNFDINGREVEVELLQDINRVHESHTGRRTPAPEVEAYLRKTPPGQFLTRNGQPDKSFSVFGGTHESTYYSAKIEDFKAFLMRIRDLTPPSLGKPFEEALRLQA